MTRVLALLFGVFLLPGPAIGGLFRAQVSLHNALLNASQAVHNSSTNMTKNTKGASEGLPGPYDPQEQRFLNGLRLMPHEFQSAVYDFNRMDKDRNSELSASEFSAGLSELEPAAVNAGKYLYNPLVQGGTSMKPPQFYRFFALAVTEPSEFAWQQGERAHLAEYYQHEKAKLIRLFITYDVDCNDGVSKEELRNGLNNTLLQGVHAAKIPVSNLFETQRETKFAEADFADFACSGSDDSPELLSLVEFVDLGKEAYRKAYAPVKSHSHHVFGCVGAFFLLCIQHLAQ